MIAKLAAKTGGSHTARLAITASSEQAAHGARLKWRKDRHGSGHRDGDDWVFAWLRAACAAAG